MKKLTIYVKRNTVIVDDDGEKKTYKASDEGDNYDVADQAAQQTKRIVLTLLHDACRK